MNQAHMNSTIPSRLRNVLQQGGIYQRAKYSWIYDSYWSLANRSIIDDRKREIGFYRALLTGFRKGDLIFDIGANQGYKTGIFLKLGAKVVSVEPDKASQVILRQSFLQYRLRNKPVVIVPKAVSDKSGIVRMWIDAPGSAMNTLSQKWAETLRNDDTRFGEKLSFGQWKEVETVSMENLIPSTVCPSLSKSTLRDTNLAFCAECSDQFLTFRLKSTCLNSGRRDWSASRSLGRLAPDGSVQLRCRLSQRPLTETMARTARILGGT